MGRGPRKNLLHRFILCYAAHMESTAQGREGGERNRLQATHNLPNERNTMATPATTTTTIRPVTVPVPQSKAGHIGTFETVAKWSTGEGQPQGSAKGTFTGPADPASLVAFYNALDQESKNRFYRDWYYGADLRKKASLRPAAAEDSPWLTRDGIRYNLFDGQRINVKTNAKLTDLPLAKRIAAINTGFQDADNFGSEPKDAFIVAKRMLLEAKQATESNGRLQPVK